MGRLEDEVATVTREYISANKQFTAVDIGNELKNRGINVRQREVSPIVRDQFDQAELYKNTSYTRTLIDVQGGNQRTFLYFSIDQSPDDYTARDQKVLAWDPNKPLFPDDKADLGGKVADDGSSQDAGGSSSGGSAGSSSSSSGQSLNVSGATGLAAVVQGSKLVGSVKSSVYHDPGCIYVSRIIPSNLMTYKDESYTRSLNLRRCRKE